MGERSVGVCILFFNKLEQTMECIESFLTPGVNIYVLNNGSEPLFRTQLGEFCRNFENVNIIDAEANLGVAVGRNVLVDSSSEDWLLFVDNDIVVKSQDWLKKFWVQVDQSKEIEVFVPKIFNTHENTYIRPVYCSIDSLNRVVFNSVTSKFTNLFPGGASFVNRNLFTRLGVYDDKMFVGFEDFELAIRGVKSKEPIKVQLIDNIELIHNHRYLPLKEDQEAVCVRYNSQLITASHDRILEKHGVFLGRDFGPWLAEQIQQMTGLRK